MSGLRFGRHRHRSVDNDNGSDVLDAIANAAFCMAGLASAAGSAMGSGTNANSKAAHSAPTGVPARSDAALAASECLIDEFPPKRRGMHWATYRRLEALEAAADHQWMAAVVTRFGRSKERRKPDGKR